MTGNVHELVHLGRNPRGVDLEVYVRRFNLKPPELKLLNAGHIQQMAVEPESFFE